MVPATLGFAGCDPKGDGPEDEDGIGVHDGDEDEDGDEEDGDEDANDDDANDDDANDDDDDDDDDDAPQPVPEPRPDATYLCDASAWEGTACTTEDGAPGTSWCIVVDGEAFDTPCTDVEPECAPGENFDQGCLGEICYWDGESFRRYSWSEPDCNTPLVVSFDGAPIEFMPAVAASFDLSADGSCQSTDWPSAPWLAIDRDGDGMIRSGGELFGNATPLAAGGHAEHGFAALAELDSDRDGKITAADARFGELVLWSDLDDDRIGATAELRPLAETSLVSIELSFARRASCDAHGNCGYERASFEYRTGAGALAVGEVVDVHVVCR